MRRRIPDDRVNLSSNELVHPRARQLLAEWAGGADPDVWRRYFAAGPVVEDIADYLGVPASDLLMTPGSDVAIRCICREYVVGASDPHLLLQFPNYLAWEAEASALGLAVSRIGDDGVDRRRQSSRLIEMARSRAGSLIAISEPNGPTGRTMEPADLDELAEIARDRGHLLVIDACYQAFHGSWRTQLARHGDSVIVAQSLSKSHGLAGARVAAVAASPARIEVLARGQIEETVSGASLLLAREMLSRTSELELIWSEIVEVREAVTERCRQRGMRPLPSGGNFLAVDLGSVEAAAAATTSLSEAGYRVRNLSDLPGLAGHVRFTVGDAETTEAMLRAWWATPAVRDAEAEALPA